jgi:hypothetical protein
MGFVEEKKKVEFKNGGFVVRGMREKEWRLYFW